MGLGECDDDEEELTWILVTIHINSIPIIRSSKTTNVNKVLGR